MQRSPRFHRPPGGGGNEPRIDADEILDGILEWVRIESPSHDGEAVNRMVDHVESAMRPLTSRIERTPGCDGFGDLLSARSEWGGDGPGILVLSHLDTVHPIGTIDDVLRVRREGDRVYGPGIYDMKGGAYLAHYAFRHLVRAGRETPLPVTFLFVPEEEVGSPTSRAAIEAAARANRYVLVTEPARDGGSHRDRPQGRRDLRNDGDRPPVPRRRPAPGRPERNPGDGPPDPAARGPDRLRTRRDGERRGRGRGHRIERGAGGVPGPDRHAGAVAGGRGGDVCHGARARCPSIPT